MKGIGVNFSLEKGDVTPEERTNRLLLSTRMGDVDALIAVRMCVDREGNQVLRGGFL